MSEKKTGTNALLDYRADAAQRYVLSLDVLRRRGNEYFAHAEMKAPHVLQFQGRTGTRRPQAAAPGELLPGAGRSRRRAPRSIRTSRRSSSSIRAPATAPASAA